MALNAVNCHVNYARESWPAETFCPRHRVSMYSMHEQYNTSPKCANEKALANPYSQCSSPEIGITRQADSVPSKGGLSGVVLGAFLPGRIGLFGV